MLAFVHPLSMKWRCFTAPMYFSPVGSDVRKLNQRMLAFVHPLSMKWRCFMAPMFVSRRELSVEATNADRCAFFADEFKVKGV